MILRRTLLKQHSVLPGFDLALGFTLLYLGFIVLIPLSAAFLKTATMTWPAFVEAVSSPRVMASYRLTFGASAVAALLNAFFGLIVAWVLVRYEFPFKRLVDALVDLPFALPTAVAGIALTALYAPNGWLGRWLVPAGIDIAFTPRGVVIALVFVGLPPEKQSFGAFSIVPQRRSISGSNTGGIQETQEMLNFCAKHGIGSTIELVDASNEADVDTAWDRVVASDVRYRFVIDASTI